MTTERWRWASDHSLFADGGREVLTTVHSMRGDPDAAKLAAAPEMLRVLKLVSGAIAPGCEATRDAVERAIALAEGRTIVEQKSEAEAES